MFRASFLLLLVFLKGASSEVDDTGTSRFIQYCGIFNGGNGGNNNNVCLDLIRRAAPCSTVVGKGNCLDGNEEYYPFCSAEDVPFEACQKEAKNSGALGLESSLGVCRLLYDSTKINLQCPAGFFLGAGTFLGTGAIKFVDQSA